MSLLIAAMVKDEANHFLSSALDAWQEIADEVIVLDDNSTDGTRELLDSRGVRVIVNNAEKAWGNEWPARQRLWDAAVASGHDWIFILDADMVPARDPKPLLGGTADGVAFFLYDLWTTDPPRFREDRFWQGHKVPRVWLFRNPGSSNFDNWNTRGIHCGHAPENLGLKYVITAPRDFSLLHYGYADEDLRRRKTAMYMSAGKQLTLHEWLHAASINNPIPNLLPLDIDIEWQLQRKS